MRLRLHAALAVLVFTPIAASTQAADIIGSWRGTSLCVDKEHFPACRDEQVIYDARAKGGSRDTVTIRADKVVDGVREFMGEFDFRRAADSSWVADYQSPRVSFRIVLQVRATHLTGILTDVPSGRHVREITLERIAQH